MLVPGIIYFIIFCYVPMYGITLAFKDFKILKGIMGSPWVGLKWIEYVLTDPYMYLVLKNTLIISTLKLICGFPVPIIFAILLNEIMNIRYKKVIQTVSYLPNFISWVICSGIFFSFFSLDGPVNTIVKLFGKEPVLFLADPKLFVPILVITDIWKGFGWSSIIYFAGITNINQELYESAIIDGANRLKQAIYITIPSLAPVITILLVLSTGSILNAGFDQIFNMYNSQVMAVSDIIDTYVFRKGIEQQSYSYATTVGLLNSIVAALLIVSSNKIAKKLGNDYTLW